MKKANPLCEICKKRPECSERFLHIWKFGVVFTALSRVFLDAQAVDGAGKVRLRGAVFAHAALLEDGLFRLIGGALCTLSLIHISLHPEGVDRNLAEYTHEYIRLMSPSTRRAWIEI